MPKKTRLSGSPTSPLAPPAARATVVGTREYERRFRARFATDYFRETTFGVAVSSIGIGTYLGECADTDDDAYVAAVRRAIGCGVNVVDTAINYRCQRSERAVGAAIQQAIAEGAATRDSLVVCTKGGYVPLERTTPETRQAYQAYVQREFLEPGVFNAEDLVAGGHSLAPRFLRYCIAKSRQNLSLRTLDVYYIHNPEQQLAAVSWSDLRVRLRSAFTVRE